MAAASWPDGRPSQLQALAHNGLPLPQAHTLIRVYTRPASQSNHPRNSSPHHHGMVSPHTLRPTPDAAAGATAMPCLRLMKPAGPLEAEGLWVPHHGQVRLRLRPSQLHAQTLPFPQAHTLTHTPCLHLNQPRSAQQHTQFPLGSCHSRSNLRPSHHGA